MSTQDQETLPQYDLTEQELVEIIKEEFGTLSMNKYVSEGGHPDTQFSDPWIVELPDGQRFLYKFIQENRLDIDGLDLGYDYGICVLKFTETAPREFLGFAYRQAIRGSIISLGKNKPEKKVLQANFNQWLVTEGGFSEEYLDLPEPVPAGGTEAPIGDLLPPGVTFGPDLPPGETLGPDLPIDEEKPLSEIIEEIEEREREGEEGGAGRGSITEGDTPAGEAGEAGDTPGGTGGIGNFTPVIIGGKLEGKFSYKFSDQQILMSALGQMSLAAGAYYSFRGAPKNYIRTSDPEALHTPPHRLKSIKTTSLRKILEMTTLEVSSLMPKIQLFKIYRDEKGNIEKEIFIPYTTDSINFIKDVFANRHQRGDDVGIKNVSFVYENQDMATAETLIGCTIEFVFQNAETLVTDREGFKYVDLFAFANTSSSEDYDKSAYEIVLKVGYEVPSGNGVLVNSELRAALREQEEMFRLQLVDYDVVFDPTGKLDASMSYSSANVEWFTAGSSDIFGLRKQMEKSEPDEGSEVSDTIIGYPTRLLDKVTLYGAIMQHMADNQMIHEIQADVFDLGNGNNKGPMPSQDQVDAVLGTFKEDAASEADKNITVPTVPYAHQRTISYFFFGDLIETIIEINPTIYEELTANQFAIILDTVGYQFAAGMPVDVLNIAHLPISLESYSEFFQNNYIKKDIKMRALIDFLKDLVTSFLSAMLRVKRNEEVAKDYKPQMVKQLVAVPGGLSDVEGVGGITTLERKGGGTFYGKSAKDHYEYYVVYDEKLYEERLNQFVHIGSTDGNRYERNLQAHIPHFFIGADRGLLKSFSFEKASINQSVAVARNVDKNNPFQQLWQIFNVNLNLVGNNLLFVGRSLYLDPTISGLGSPYDKGSVSNLMGLGGYYMIEKVSHSYYPSWETVVSAKIIDSARPDQVSRGTKLEFRTPPTDVASIHSFPTQNGE